MVHYLFILASVYLFVCPFTKVEESFNLQATHDIIFYKWNLTQFDHFEFPGVVPRSFLGPLAITLLLSPILTVLDFFGVVTSNKFICQYLVRGTLGCCVLFSFQKLHKTVREKFGDGVARWFSVLTITQYHFMFYLSRPLPNIIALPLVLLALSSWIKEDHFSLICFSAVAVVIFRFELTIFLGPMIIIEIAKKNFSFIRTLKIGTGAAVSSLVCTVAVDSVFWGRLIWPEGEVFWFNVILNKSSDYGTSPFFWYWYSALPRALGASIIFVPLGDKRTKLLLAPALILISAMSFLPHKELRFIIYTFPLFNISAATFCHKVWMNRSKSLNYWIGSCFISLHLVANICLSCLLLRVASENYPGGAAIMRLHKLLPSDVSVHVYIDNLAAQTGVSRFTQLNSNWTYNKTENLSADDYFVFSHLLLEAKSKYSPNLKPFLHSHEVLDIIEGFSHVHFNYNHFPPFKIKLKPFIFIMKKNNPPKEDSFEGPSELSETIESSIVDQNESIVNNFYLTETAVEGISDEPENNSEPKVSEESIQPLESSKMNVEDFFSDFEESSHDLQRKKYTANRVAKMSAFKDKKPKDL